MTGCLKTQTLVNGKKNQRYWQIFLSPGSSLKMWIELPVLCPESTPELYSGRLKLSTLPGAQLRLLEFTLWHLFIFPYNLISQLQPTLSSTSTGFSWEDWGTSIFKLTAFLWSEFQMFAHSWQAWQLYSRYFIVNDVVISQVSRPWEQKIINTESSSQIGKWKHHYHIDGLCYDFYYSVHCMYVWTIKAASYHYKTGY